MRQVRQVNSLCDTNNIAHSPPILPLLFAKIITSFNHRIMTQFKYTITTPSFFNNQTHTQDRQSAEDFCFEMGCDYGYSFVTDNVDGQIVYTMGKAS